jgi:iron complex outermembrane receptor protein
LLQAVPGTTAVAQTAPAGATSAQSCAPGDTACQAQNHSISAGAGSVPEASGSNLAPPAGEKAESIVVTGSRLKHSDVTSESPVTIVTAAQIQHSGAQTIEDVLQKLPAIGTGGIYSTTNNGGEGASCVDLRNLGYDRTLILINGKRFPQTQGSTFSCVDLDNIPVALVDRIDILKDGASAIYGADAVAGVINIITKTNFSGTTFTANGALATGGGDRTGDLSFTTGANFDKGNITFSAGYENREPIVQTDRDWAHYVQVDNQSRGTKPDPRSGVVGGEVGSGIPLGGRVFGSPNTDSYYSANYQGLGGRLGTGGAGSKPFTNADRFNWGDYTYLASGLERWNIASSVNYEITPEINFYAQGYYTHLRTTQQLAPDPVTGAYPGNPTATDIVIPAGNPFLQALETEAGFAPGPSDAILYKRFGELGTRNYIQNNDTFNIVTGFKGDLAYGWSYDVFFNYGRSSKTEVEQGIVNTTRLEQELGFQQTNTTSDPLGAYFNNGDLVTSSPAYPLTNQTSGLTQPFASGVANDAGVYNPLVCNAAVGCTLANPFGPHGLTAAQANYIRVNNNQQTQYTLRQWGGNVTNNDIYELPYGPVGVVFGAEHRSEAGSYTPDSVVLAGQTSDPPVNPTNGGFDTTEVYGELRIPILKDLFLAKDLHLDLSGRYSHYNTFGDAETWKISGNYSPTSDVRFRASIGTAFRQPTINDLYGGGTVSYNTAGDPCTSPTNANAIANCKKIGALGVANVNGQVPTLEFFGNPLLQPETARTYTIGGVFTPTFVPRLSATADFYHTRINNGIGSLDTGTILTNCYNSPNFSSPLCPSISRLAGTNQLNLVDSPTQNLGETRETGLDLGLNYSYVLPNDIGTLSFSNDFEFLFSYLLQTGKNSPFIQFAGQIVPGGIPGTAGSEGLARRKDNLSISLAHLPFNFGYRMRYISGMNLSYYNGVNGFAPALVNNTDEVFYHDLYVSYDWRNISATIGADNIGDKRPPFVPDGESNTVPAVYDVVGRLVYLKTTFRF